MTLLVILRSASDEGSTRGALRSFASLRMTGEC
jgi:hypothetical protein